MLLYPNKGLRRVIAQYTGSIFFRCDVVFWGIVTAIVTAVIQILCDLNEDFLPKLPHPYGMHALGTVVGFAVVFRTTYSWQRYWEAISQLHTMYSKWEDSYSQLLAFCAVSIEKYQDKGTEEAVARCRRLTSTTDGALNMFSLMSAYAADRLLHGDNERMQRRLKVGKWSDQVVTRRQLREGEDITGATRLPRLNVSRRGSVRTSTDCNDWSDETYNVCVEPPEELKDVLKTSSDKTGVVMYWLIHDMASLADDLGTPPPIQSRMYQELSNGMLGFNQAQKIADVPFPFPFAQMLSLLMIFFTLFVPIYVVIFTQSVIVGPIMSFLLFEGIWGLNELAKELETPFGTDINHIPLEDFHQRFVDSCSDMHRAHAAKIQVCAEPTARGIRRGNERRPSVATLTSRSDPGFLKEMSDPDWSPKAFNEDEMTQIVLPSSLGAETIPTTGGSLTLPTSGHLGLPPLQRLPMMRGRSLSGEEEFGRGRMLLPPKAVGLSASRRQEKLNNCSPLGDPSAGLKDSLKALEEQLLKLNQRMEQHLARIAEDTQALCEASRTLCQRRFSSSEPLQPPGPPPHLDDYADAPSGRCDKLRSSATPQSVY